ncbi:MAG: RNA polymerase sigma factor [Myxococcota bacterium]
MDLSQHLSSIRRYLAGILRPDEIEDATQTVLQRALENLQRYRGDSSFRVWVLGIARNVGLEVARARQREITRTWGPRASDTGEDLVSSDLLAIDVPSQEERLGDKEEQALLLMALDRMQLDDSLCLTMTYFDGLKGPEVAALRDMSFAAFRQRLSRARKTLKAEMSRLRSSGFVASPDLIKKWEAATDPHGRARALAAERAASQNGEQSVAPINKTNE